MPEVYDKEKEETQGGAEGELRRQQEQDRGIQAGIQATKQKFEDSDWRKRMVDTSTPGTLEDLKRLEGQEGERLKKAIPTTDMRYRKEKPGAAAKLKGLAKKAGKHKKLLLGTSAGGGVLVLGFIFVILTLGSLLIPNFAQDMVAYQFARVTRETMASDTSITAEKDALDAASDNSFKQAWAKYQNLKDGVWGKINQYRPKKVVENMKASSNLYYDYGPPEKVKLAPTIGGKTITRQRVIGINVNGAEIDVSPLTYTSLLDKIAHPLNYAKALFQINKAVKTTLAETMDNTLRGTNYIIRGRVADRVLAGIKGERLAWTEKDLEEYNGADTEAADDQNATESYAAATDDGEAAATANTDPSAEDSTATAAQAANDACVKDTKCLNEMLKNSDSLSVKSIGIMNSAFDSTAFKSLLGDVSLTYAFIVPLCLMLQGSIVHSGSVIKANSQEDERTANRVEAAADQQKYGNVNGNAIGALARQMGSSGEVARSNVEQRAAGEPINTIQSGVTPQASASGTYTYDVFDFLPQPLDSVFSSVADPLCAVLDNIWAGISLGILQIAIQLAQAAAPGLGEALDAGEQVGITTMITIIKDSIVDSVKDLFSDGLKAVGKKATKGGAKFGGVATITVLGALLAKMITVSHMGAANNGLARNQSYDDQADAGANLNAQDIDRQQNYAAPMTASGTAEAKTQDTAYLTQQEQSQSAFQRYFAVDNPTSLVDKLGTMTIADMNTGSLSSIVTSAARIFNPVTAFSSVFSLFQSKSMAAAATTTDNSDYGVLQWGWTPIEEWHYENDPNYSMLTNQQKLDESGQESAIASKYGKCFTDDVSYLLQKGYIQRDENGNIITNVGDCAPDNLSPINRDDPDASDNLVFANSTAQLVFRYRVAKRNDNNLGQLIDTQNATATQ
ncbi:MAG TPA: hypothetical protein VGG13_03200 [Candidatus Saccharimonadales bacterium]|jgi:ABC-type multidrug transport system fused ATPase/permease subunit